MRAQFIQALRAHLPTADLETMISEQLISPHTVTLPNGFMKQAEELVDSLHRLKSQKTWQESVHPTGKEIDSVCMSVDVHWNNNQIWVIEVNTNASFLALGKVLKEAWGRQSSHQDVIEMFRSYGEPNAIAIVDDEPERQKLFVEFLLYQAWFRQEGWRCEILDSQADLSGFDLIYNRSTDFLLEHSPQLKKADQNPRQTVTPNSWDYMLLANKQNLIAWSEQKMKFIPRTIEFTEENRAQLWHDRKKYVFKPKQSYGSKQVYRGSSISNVAFNRLTSGEFVAQEFIPPNVLNQGGQEFKCDFRIFFFRNQILDIIARLYQGQVTNTQTPGGGWAMTR